MNVNPKSKDYLFVGIQFLLLALFFVEYFKFQLASLSFLQYPGLVMSVFGFLLIVIAILQLNKNLTPFPTPKDNGTLITTGLYKYMRHPIYTGIFFATLGLGLFNKSLWQIGIAIALLVLFYFKSKYEESLLIEKFEDYQEYMKRTRRFL